jgi:oxygen-dependent protoporphyrinogen oxidase
MEYFVPRPPVQTDSTERRDESLASFARRRMGREAFDRLIQPLVGGIYTADPEKLSLAATLPRFLQMEQEYRSLIRAGWQQRKAHNRMKSSSPAPASGARYGMFVAPRYGMSALVNALTNAIAAVEVRLNSAVRRLEQAGDKRWLIGGNTGAGSELFDAVIVSTRAPIAANLLSGVDADLAAEVSALEYASTALVCLGYRRSQIAHPLNGFGLVVPSIERRKILAASFASVKFAGRAPSDRVLIRVFIGGALEPKLVDYDEAELEGIARRELKELIGANGEPELIRVIRWRNAMPQYHVGHLDRVQRIMSRVADIGRLGLAGSAYEGVGIPHCIHSGQQAADRVAKAAAPEGLLGNAARPIVI